MANISDQLFNIVDIETTGLDPAKDRIVEIAVVSTRQMSGDNLSMWASLVNPEMPMPPEVSAIHMLTDADVKNAPTWQDAIWRYNHYIDQTADLDSVPISVAHNAEFDSAFVDPHGRDKWLCTKRLAQHLWPDAPSHRNQVLRYWRQLDVDTFGILPHRALADALVTAELLRDLLYSEEFRALNIHDPDELIAFANRPIRVRKWDFGRFKDQPIEAADTGWIDWCLRTIKDKPDLIYTLRLGREEGWLH